MPLSLELLLPARGAERQPQQQAPAPPAPPAPSSAPSADDAAAAVTPPNFNAAYLNNPPPVYPYGARQRHETGEGRLRVLVTATGVAGDVKIEKSSGSSSLDQAARSSQRASSQSTSERRFKKRAISRFGTASGVASRSITLRFSSA